MLLQNPLEHRKIFCRIGTNVLTPVFLHTKVMLTLSIIIPLNTNLFITKQAHVLHHFQKAITDPKSQFINNDQNIRIIRNQ